MVEVNPVTTTTTNASTTTTITSMARILKKNVEGNATKLVQCLTPFEKGCENFTRCQEFVLSNILFHRFLEVLPTDVCKKLKRLQDRFAIESLCTTVKKLDYLSNKFFQIVNCKTSEADGLYSSLYLLLLLAKNPKRNCESFEETFEIDSDAILRQILFEEDEDGVFSAKFDCAEHYISTSDDDYEPVTEDSDSGVDVCPQADIVFGTDDCRDDAEEVYVDEWLHENVINPYWKSSVSVGFTITEKQLVCEFLWMAQGIENLAAFHWDGESYSVVPRLQLSHLCETTLVSLMKPICHYGTLIKHLRKFVDETCRSTSLQTYQAYCTVLSLLINDILRKVSELEADVTKNYGSKLMQEVLQEVEFILTDLDYIYEAHAEGIEKCSKNSSNWNKVSSLITSLYRRLVDLDSVTFSVKGKMLLILFIGTVKPFFDFIESLTTKTVALDLAQEFFIVRNNITLMDENYWNDSLSTRYIPEDFFLSSVLPDVILAGKSMDVINCFGQLTDSKIHKGSLFQCFKENLMNTLIEKGYSFSNEKPIDSFSFENSLLSHFKDSIPKRDVLLENNFLHLLQLATEDIKKENANETDLSLLGMKMGSIYPLQLLIEQSLFPSIQKMCYDANHKLLTVLKKHHLTEHLAVCRKYFLMESGEVMHYFSSRLFEKLYGGEELTDQYSLNSILQEALSAFHSRERPRLNIVIVKNSMEMDIPKILQDITKVKLFYEVPWPANILLNSHCVDVHQKIFTVILQIKCAKYSLDELRLKDLTTDSAVEDANASEMDSSICEPPWEAKQRVMFFMRIKLLHFINSLHTHFMINNLHSTNLHLGKILDQASDFQEMQEFYKKYLLQISLRCLLESGQHILRQLVLKTVSICIDFSKCWKQGVHDTRASELFRIDDTFNKYHKFLIAVITMLQKRNVFYMDSLAYALLCEQDCVAIVPKSWE